MSTTFEWLSDADQKEDICRETLARLPLWFGLPDSNNEYATAVRGLGFLAARVGQDHVGFCSVRENSKFTVEVYVMAIRPEFHRKGIGKGLIGEVISWSSDRDFALLEVKTLDGSRESDEYRKTRLFYRAQGFLPLETIVELWGPENPCLIMVRPLIGPQSSSVFAANLSG